ncbi:DEAD/DEAH box helicase, partial [Candidatus Poseidonia alphae]|nr:DEAD/DEAH box helicase [Candidatus Poseidonia alphae]
MEGPITDVNALGMPQDFSDFLKNEWGITNLHPPQAEAASSILSGRNTLVAIPTASGKSLLAYMAMIQRLTEGHK